MSLQEERYDIITYEDGVTILIITEVTETDAGRYEVEAVNEVGRATTTCTLTIIGISRMNTKAWFDECLDSVGLNENKIILTILF